MGKKILLFLIVLFRITILSDSNLIQTKNYDGKTIIFSDEVGRELKEIYGMEDNTIIEEFLNIFYKIKLNEILSIENSQFNLGFTNIKTDVLQNNNFIHVFCKKSIENIYDIFYIIFYPDNLEVFKVNTNIQIYGDNFLSSKELFEKALFYRNSLIKNSKKYQIVYVERFIAEKNSVIGSEIRFYFGKKINNYLSANMVTIILNPDGTLKKFTNDKYPMFENKNLKKLITKEKAYEIAEAFLREKAVEWGKISAEDIKKLKITPLPKTRKLKYKDRPIYPSLSVFDGMRSNRPMYVFPNYYYIKNPYSIPEDSILPKFGRDFPDMFELNWVMKLRLAYPVLLVGNMPINIFFITKSNMTGFYIDAETGEVIGGW